MNTPLTESAWYLFPILASMSTFVSGAIIGMLKISGDWPRRIVSWLVPIALVIIAYFAGLYTVTGQAWVGIAAMCFMTMLASNGVYKIPQIEAFVRNLFKYVNQDLLGRAKK